MDDSNRNAHDSVEIDLKAELCSPQRSGPGLETPIAREWSGMTGSSGTAVNAVEENAPRPAARRPAPSGTLPRYTQFSTRRLHPCLHLSSRQTHLLIGGPGSAASGSAALVTLAQPPRQHAVPASHDSVGSQPMPFSRFMACEKNSSMLSRCRTLVNACSDLAVGHQHAVGRPPCMSLSTFLLFLPL